jgi:glutamate-ammonia-ligase adenylyltransferase
MLRGNAKDLEVPPLESLEFGHLARRMGYTSTSGRSAAERLRADLGGYMAYVRDFCRRRFGRSVLVSRDTGNLADVGLALDLDADTTREILERTGFENWERAAWNLRSLVAAGGDRDLLCQVVVLAEPLLRASADSDMALNNWERYIQKVISPRAFHESLLRRPQEMEIFLDIVAASQFLADVLIRNPEYFPWVLQPDNLLQHRSPQDFRSQILEETRAVTQADRVFDAIRRTRRRELLRIGTRDLCLGVPFEETVQDLSRLAAEVIRSVLLVEAGNIDGASQILGRGGLTVLAFGKLGAGELNYSSDVDLLAFLDGPGSTGADATEQEVATRLLQQAIHTLTTASQEGHLYRVDMRLRPFGSQGALVGSRDALVDYYRHKARPWEVQALLKAGAVVAQDPAKERDFLLERIRDGLRRWSASDLAADARRSRLAGRQRAAARRPGQTPRLDVKTGEGGIRDVEFAVQHLQLLYHNRGPELLVPATLPAIQKLVSHGVLDPEKGTTLEHNYLLLRRIEHLLQIMHDRQIHAMPTDDNSLQALCRRLNRDQDSPARLRRDVETALQTNLTFFDHTCTPGA